MNQHPNAAYIISMIALDLKVIYLNRVFKDLVLNLFNDYIFTVDGN